MTQEDYLQKAREIFFMQKPNRFSLTEIDDVKIEAAAVRSAFSVFNNTLTEIVRAVQAFYNMAMASSIDSRLNQILVSNILLTKADFIVAGKEEDKAAIHAEARRRTTEIWQREDRHDELLKDTASQLVTLAESVPELIASSNNAILRQSSVMLWSAVESLLRDYFRIAINKEPSLAKKLLSSDESKRFWSLRDITFDVIEDADFNLQDCMGDVLLQINSMINLNTIRAGYRVISDNNALLMMKLSSRETYRLFALRNLVAHRNGIVDQKFLEESDFSVVVGEKFSVTPSVFEEMYMAAKALAVALFEFHQSSSRVP